MKKINIDAMTSSKNENFETPQSFFNVLNEKYNFDIDLAANESNAKCKNFVLDLFDPKIINVLSLFKDGAAFLNPPYGKKIGSFIKKAVEIATEFNLTLVMLLPARVDTKWFNLIWNRELQRPKPFFEVEFIQGRLFFELNGKPILDKKNRKQSALFPSMLVIYNPGVN